MAPALPVFLGNVFRRHAKVVDGSKVNANVKAKAVGSCENEGRMLTVGQFIQALSEELHLKWWLTEEDNWKVAAAVAADKNKDGLVSWSEFIEFLTPLLKDAFSRRPSDNDWVALETKVCLHSASALHVHVACGDWALF
jgi:hypothetical protein